MSELIKYLLSFFSKVKAPYQLAVGLSLVLAVCLYILNPGGNTYISVPGDRLVFVSPTFQRCHITLLSSRQIRSYEVSLINPSVAVVATRTSVNCETSELMVDNHSYGKSGSSSNVQYKVTVYIGPSVSTEIKTISIDGQPIPPKTFVAKYIKGHPDIKGNGELVRFNYIRKLLADLISRLNDPVSNFLLTAMTFGLIIFLSDLLVMEARAYLYPKKYFLRYLTRLLNIQNLSEQGDDAQDKYNAHWAMWDNRFRFLQALGPAVGFILTVSSLIQALHPSGLTATDLDQFLNGIHVAMISTFLGLALRLVALEAARINDFLWKRAHELLSPAEAPTPVGS